MKIHRRRYLWAGPLLIAAAGILYLVRSDISEGLRTSWIVVTALAAVLVAVGIWLHFFISEDSTPEGPKDL